MGDDLTIPELNRRLRNARLFRPILARAIRDDRETSYECVSAVNAVIHLWTDDIAAAEIAEALSAIVIRKLERARQPKGD